MHALAAVHLDPLATWPVGFGLGLGVSWYAAVLARPGTRLSRRVIRGASLVVLVAIAVGVVAASSHIDRATHPRRYALVWTANVGGLLLLVLIAAADFVDGLMAIGRSMGDGEDAPAPQDLRPQP